MLINFDYLNSVTGGDKDILKQILQAYIDYMPADVTELKKLLQGDDHMATGMQAHKVKSSARMIGLPCASLLQDIENFAKTNTNIELIPSKMELAIDELYVAMEEIKQVIEQI